MLNISQDVKTVDRLLAKDYLILADLGLSLKDNWERNLVPAYVLYLHKNNKDNSYLAAACQSFYLFFRFHYQNDENTRKNILLGDYFFSRFLELLLQSGHYHLLSHFYRFVTEKCQKPLDDKAFSIAEILPFVAFIAGEGESESPEALPYYRPYGDNAYLAKAKPII